VAHPDPADLRPGWHTWKP